MRKTALFLSALLVSTALLHCGFAGAPATACAAPGDLLPLNQAFLEALLSAGVDTNGDGGVSEGEMAARTELTVVGSAVTDVTGISWATNLTSLTITGTSVAALPAEFANLTLLTSLDISGNRFASLPAPVLGCTALTSLDAGNNGISSLPDEIGCLTALRRLDLKMNALSSLPSGIGGLVNLTELNLYHNLLTGLPDAVGNLVSLTALYLHRNSLTALPDALCGLPSLSVLMLWDNDLTALPLGIGSLPSLTELDVAGNYLDPRPGSADRTPLDTLASRGARVTYATQNQYAVSLNYNGGSGPALPKAGYYHGESVTLPAASKSGHFFSGWDGNGDGLPDAAGGQTVAVQPVLVTAATQVYAAVYGHTVTFRTEPFGTIGGGTADITAEVNAGERVSSIPEVTANAGYISLGWYEGNTPVTESAILAADITTDRVFTARFEAEGTVHFPDAAFQSALIAAGADENGDGFITGGEMRAQTSLQLSGGQFADITGIEEATNLVTLRLGAGRVASLPAEIGGLAALEILDVGGNPLSALPDSVAGLANLRALDVGGCGLGTLPAWLWGMAGLTSLDIGGNNLETIPAGIAALTGLTELYCNGNALRAFPSAVSFLTALRRLNLSGNLLTELPAGCFEGLSSLTSVDLSNNYFNPDTLTHGLPPGVAVILPQVTYAVSLDFNGGAGSALPKSGYYYGETVVLPAASKADFSFCGWDFNGDGAADTAGAGADARRPSPPDAVSGWSYRAVYKSSNASLSALALTAGAYMTGVFNPSVTAYEVVLYDYVDTVTITPAKAGAGAAMRIDGAAQASVTVRLASPGDETAVTIALTSEDGSRQREYTLHVSRARPVDMRLSGLYADVALTPAFSPDTADYAALLPAVSEGLWLSASCVSAESSVSVYGSGAASAYVPVSPGGTVTVPVTVLSPLTTDRTRTYSVTVRRGTTVTGFSARPTQKGLPTLSPGGSNRMTFVYTMGGPGTVKLEIYRKRKWVTLMTRAEDSAGAKAWAWDGKLGRTKLSLGTYKVRITPAAHGMEGAAYTISVKLVGTAAVTWRSAVRTFKANGTLRNVSQFKVKYPTNAVVQVLNAKGKLVATLSSETDMPAATYRTIMWDGRAGEGNTARLAAGALVPKGTYKIKVTVGAKAYTRSFKVTR